MKILVLYYSRSGNTKAVAEALAAALGGASEALEDNADYTGAAGYLRAGRDALVGRTAVINPLRHKPADYDVVLLGQPVWGARPVPAVNGFLAAQPLTGKKVALFVTYDGGGAKGCLERTAGRLSGSDIIARNAFLRVGKDRDKALDQAAQWAAELKRDLGPA